MTVEGACTLKRDGHDKGEIVMARLVPAIHALLAAGKKVVDARNKYGMTTTMVTRPRYE
jgi:hypothetical protein